jgi:hypothetical protein
MHARAQAAPWVEWSRTLAASETMASSPGKDSDQHRTKRSRGRTRTAPKHKTSKRSTAKADRDTGVGAKIRNIKTRKTRKITQI